MHDFWYDYEKLKYEETAELCYMDKNSFIVYIKTKNIYKGIAKDVETRFGTSKVERPLQKGKNKNVIGLMTNQVEK